MAFCPNCAAEVSLDAAHCSRCIVRFDQPGGWRPASARPRRHAALIFTLGGVGAAAGLVLSLMASTVAFFAPLSLLPAALGLFLGLAMGVVIASLMDLRRRSHPGEPPVVRQAPPAASTPGAGVEIELAVPPDDMTQPRGLCPNCGANIALNSASCRHCKALFVAGSGWKVSPLP